MRSPTLSHITYLIDGVIELTLQFLMCEKGGQRTW